MAVWAKIITGLRDHPKAQSAGPRAMWMYVTMILYAKERDTNGRVPVSFVSVSCHGRAPLLLASRLVDVGLLRATDDGWEILKYNEKQGKGASLSEKRADERERQKRHREGMSHVTPPPSHAPRAEQSRVEKKECVKSTTTELLDTPPPSPNSTAVVAGARVPACEAGAVVAGLDEAEARLVALADVEVTGSEPLDAVLQRLIERHPIPCDLDRTMAVWGGLVGGAPELAAQIDAAHVEHCQRWRRGDLAYVPELRNWLPGWRTPPRPLPQPARPASATAGQAGYNPEADAARLAAEYPELVGLTDRFEEGAAGVLSIAGHLKSARHGVTPDAVLERGQRLGRLVEGAKA